MGSTTNSKGTALGALASQMKGVSDGSHAKNLGENSQEDFFEQDTGFEEATIPSKRGVGRPVGSAAKSTLQMRQYLAQKGYRDPLEFLASIYSTDVVDLAKALHCEREAAARLQIQAAREAVPYVHQQMPKQIEVQREGERPMFFMGNIQQNQSLIDLPPEKSQDNKSQGEE